MQGFCMGKRHFKLIAFLLAGITCFPVLFTNNFIKNNKVDVYSINTDHYNDIHDATIAFLISNSEVVTQIEGNDEFIAETIEMGLDGKYEKGIPLIGIGDLFLLKYKKQFYVLASVKEMDGVYLLWKDNSSAKKSIFYFVNLHFLGAFRRADLPAIFRGQE